MNVSEEVLNLITSRELKDITLHIAVLPVSFEKAPEKLRSLAEEILPDLIIMLWETSQSDVVRLERVALNFMDADREDNCGRKPIEETIRENAPAALFSSFPIKKIKDLLSVLNFKVKISNSAGVYVCNRVYYECLEIAKEQEIEALFVHLPVETTHYSIDKLKSMLVAILNHYRICRFSRP